MGRLDSQYAALKNSLGSAQTTVCKHSPCVCLSLSHDKPVRSSIAYRAGVSKGVCAVQEEAAAIKGKMQARADQLMATYTQIALQVRRVHLCIVCLAMAQ